jgi:hypothetical protein
MHSYGFLWIPMHSYGFQQIARDSYGLSKLPLTVFFFNSLPLGPTYRVGRLAGWGTPTTGTYPTHRTRRAASSQQGQRADILFGSLRELRLFHCFY